MIANDLRFWFCHRTLSNNCPTLEPWSIVLVNIQQFLDNTIWRLNGSGFKWLDVLLKNGEAFWFYHLHTQWSIQRDAKQYIQVSSGTLYWNIHRFHVHSFHIYIWVYELVSIKDSSPVENGSATKTRLLSFKPNHSDLGKRMQYWDSQTPLAWECQYRAFEPAKLVGF